MFNVRSLADAENPKSFSNKLRQRRFTKFKKLVENFPRPLRIIDIGGTELFWEQRGWANDPDYEILTVNIKETPTRHSNITSVAGDATDLSMFQDCEFDVAFSNSVIEHLFTYDNQALMAREVRRVAKSYWVQTPNYWFPIEPHYHVPGWQWMPKIARTCLIRHFRCGWRGPCDSWDEAKLAVNEVRLMTMSEIRQLFPNGNYWTEKIFGLNKSLVAYYGFAKTI